MKADRNVADLPPPLFLHHPGTIFIILSRYLSYNQYLQVETYRAFAFSNVEREKTPPKPIYLEGALPPQCELLVTDSETQAEKSEDDDDAPVVLSGKMTLSLISLDQIAAVRKY